MPTGLTIRDFNKAYRELRYENEGSIRLSEIEHNAYLNRLTVEITHYDAYRSVSYKTNPDNTHWGYLTSFKGSSVVSNQAVKFAKQRVYENINQGMWAYHQSSESLNLSTSVAEASLNTFVVGGVIGEATDTLLRLYIKAKESLTDALANNAAWLVGSRSFNENENEGVDYSYTAFPVASPFPDVFKFKSDIPVSFLFRLESWYLVNPAVYIVANPTDTSDETEGEDEYPQPSAGPGTGEGANFPPPSLPDGQSDPDDFGDLPPDSNVSLRVRYTVVAWRAGCVPFQGDGFLNVPWEGSYNYSLKYISEKNGGCSGAKTKLGLVLVSPSGGEYEITNVGTEMREGSRINSYEIV